MVHSVQYLPGHLLRRSGTFRFTLVSFRGRFILYYGLKYTRNYTIASMWKTYCGVAMTVLGAGAGSRRGLAARPGGRNRPAGPRGHGRFRAETVISAGRGRGGSPTTSDESQPGGACVAGCTGMGVCGGRRTWSCSWRRLSS